MLKPFCGAGEAGNWYSNHCQFFPQIKHKHTLADSSFTTFPKKGIGSAGLPTLLVTGSNEGFYALLLLVTTVLTSVVMPVVKFAYVRVYLENRPRSDIGWAGDAIENRPGAGPDGSEW